MLMLYLIALHEGHAGATFEPAGGIASAIQAAGVREPSAIVAALSQAALYSMADIAELNEAEAAELVEGLQAVMIPLGDRARLRKIYEKAGSCHDFGAGNRWLQAGAIDATKGGGGGGAGISIEVAAIAFTGLIGMVGYLVQARSAQNASEAQAGIEREAAERDKMEVKAAKQLERVQRQNEDFVYPVITLIFQFMCGFDRAAFNCGCEGFMTLQGHNWVSPRTQPHVSIFQHTQETAARTAATPFAHTLPSEDLEWLAADPARRGQWQELIAHMVLPWLRELMPILLTKVQGPCSLGTARC